MHVGYDNDFKTLVGWAVGYDYGFEKAQSQTLVTFTNFETSVKLIIGHGYKPKKQVSHENDFKKLLSTA